MSTEKLDNLPITDQQPDNRVWTEEADKLYELGQINAVEASIKSGLPSVEIEFVDTTDKRPDHLNENKSPKSPAKPKLRTWREKAWADRYSSPDGTKYKF